MKCDLEYVEPYERLPGFHLYRCCRLGCEIKPYSPYGPERVESECQGWPYRHEWGNWFALILAALWITKPRYGRLFRKGATGCPVCDKREHWWNRLGSRLFRRASPPR